MPRHNIRPEVVPLIVEVLRESKQCKGVLSEGPGCYCFEGAVCEAYRRAHPGAMRWDSGESGLDRRMRHWPVIYGRSYGGSYAPRKVYEWALVDPSGFEFVVDKHPAPWLNDHGYDFPTFIAALEAE